MSPTTIRILLADDHTLVRAGLRRVLEAHHELVVVGETDTGQATIDVAGSTPIDVLVLDLNMPTGDGFAVLAAVKRQPQPPKIVVLTMHRGREYVARALREGADAYLLKDAAVHDLVAAVHAVVRGRRYFSAAVQDLMADWLAIGTAHQRADLTDREREVLAWLARGLSSREVAGRLAIGVRTVETHRANLMQKLGVKSVATLIQVALREGLIEPPPDP